MDTAPFRDAYERVIDVPWQNFRIFKPHFRHTTTKRFRQTISFLSVPVTGSFSHIFFRWISTLPNSFSRNISGNFFRIFTI